LIRVDPERKSVKPKTQAENRAWPTLRVIMVLVFLNGRR
jgi:hypothetical protein